MPVRSCCFVHSPPRPVLTVKCEDQASGVHHVSVSIQNDPGDKALSTWWQASESYSRIIGRLHGKGVPVVLLKCIRITINFSSICSVLDSSCFCSCVSGELNLNVSVCKIDHYGEEVVSRGPSCWLGRGFGQIGFTFHAVQWNKELRMERVPSLSWQPLRFS